MTEELWRGREPGDVPSRHPPFLSASLVWSHQAGSPGGKSAFMNGPLAAAFRLQRRRGSTAASRNNEVPTLSPPKETQSISTVKLSEAAEFMLRRIENEYLAVSTKSACAD